jgi:CRP-like cAMP-binding protein
MTGLASPCGAHEVRPVIWKLRSLGLEGEAELRALLKLIKVRAGRSRGEEIIRAGTKPTRATVLLDGVACSYERLKDGGRQIYAFQYPGDICDLHRHVLPEPEDEIAVAALTDCSIGIIDYRDLDRLIAQYPTLGLALWRATMLEASISRQRLLNMSRRPALQRVAHLLCELLARREAIGINGAVIPLSQIDLADATGLSVVHINRTIQGLRTLGILSPDSRAIAISDRERLIKLAGYDGRYLNMPQILSYWQISIERGSTAARSSRR